MMPVATGMTRADASTTVRHAVLITLASAWYCLAMDPELAEALTALPPFDFADPAAQRAAFQDLAATMPQAPPDPRVCTRDHAVPRPDGSTMLVRTYRPAGATGVLPVVMWFHGGGFVLGSVDVDDPYCTELALRTSAVVVSPEYRLAPEHPFPAGVEDCYAAATWAAANAADFAGDGSRLAVAGGSAGGNLAGAVALMARDRGGPRIAFQALLCPAVAERRPEPSNHSYDRATSVIVPEDNEHILQHYLGDQRKEIPPYAMPPLAQDLTGLPPAYVLTAGLDYLRYAGVRYATALDRAGVSVELHLVPEVPHGFDAIAMQAPTAQRIIAEYTRALAAALALPAPSGEKVP